MQNLYWKIVKMCFYLEMHLNAFVGQDPLGPTVEAYSCYPEPKFSKFPRKIQRRFHILGKS